MCKLIEQMDTLIIPSGQTGCEVIPSYCDYAEKDKMKSTDLILC